MAPRVAALLGHEPTGPESEDELRNLREPGPADERTLAELAAAPARGGHQRGRPALRAARTWSCWPGPTWPRSTPPTPSATS
ncbi:MAG: hypothetical protein R2746_16900 [Acidimicrobiales bacterium]